MRGVLRRDERGGGRDSGWAGGAERLAPGLAVVLVITALAWLLAQLPGLALLGTLALALLLGVAARLLLGAVPTLLPGARFASSRLLRLGVVLLGARLQFDLLAAAGPTALLLAGAVVVVGLVAMESLGRWLGVGAGLRRVLAVGTTICGASAIAAAAPVTRADEEEAAIAVALVSLLGAAGVVGFALLAEPLGLGPRTYALLTGATLHEVGHVLAAGAAMGQEALDLSTLVKLVRVALLAPVLLLVGALVRASAPRTAPGRAGPAPARRPPLLPAFLVGFLLLGVARGVGALPGAWVEPLSSASLVLTAAAMAGIGLCVDPAGLKRAGSRALLLAVAGFGATLTVAALVLVAAG